MSETNDGHMLSTPFSVIILFVLVMLNYIIKIITDIFILAPEINMLNTRPWPPMKIYYHHLPNEFNYEGIAKSPLVWFTPFDGHYQFSIEFLFANFIKQVPILTDNIADADIVYFDFFPYYNAIKQPLKQQLEIGKRLYNNLKENNLTRKRLFSIQVYPWFKPCTFYLLGYTGSYELINKNHKWVVIPYLSNFTNFPASQLDINAPRNITVFLSGSYRAQRKQIFQIMKEYMPNSLGLVINRSNDTNSSISVEQTPFYMSQSKYCIIPHGDSPSSKRFYDAVIYGCIPVIIADGFVLPFDKTIIDWDQCIIRIPQKDVETLPSVIGNITEAQYQKMYNYLLSNRNFIRFDNGVQSDNGVGTILWELYYKYQEMQGIEWEINDAEISQIELRLEKQK